MLGRCQAPDKFGAVPEAERREWGNGPVKRQAAGRRVFGRVLVQVDGEVREAFGDSGGRLLKQFDGTGRDSAGSPRRPGDRDIVWRALLPGNECVRERLKRYHLVLIAGKAMHLSSNWAGVIIAIFTVRHVRPNGFFCSAVIGAARRIIPPRNERVSVAAIPHRAAATRTVPGRRPCRRPPRPPYRPTYPSAPRRRPGCARARTPRKRAL